ncbi:uncharacterized protein LOC119591104 [Penaeus monodon]|uniref:uncharacterized protein LOC119591104 n=1 Tax=Penaeus monodon TaxID=6687 RepID=UPI0018A7B9E0|nr:uncharacterized protein LOC119591104 [Penaeus monodon]
MNKENEVPKDLVRPDLANSAAASNLAFNEKVKAMIRAGRKIYHFAFGQSPFPVPPCLVKAMQEYAHVHEYLPMTGILELREELVKFHARHDRLDLDVDSMVVGPGSKELIYLTMATFSGGKVPVIPVIRFILYPILILLYFTLILTHARSA